MNDLAGRRNVRLRFIGYTANDPLDRRTAMVYGDDVGLSAARAKRAMETVSAQMDLEPSQAEHEGRGFVHSDDVVNAGFIRGETSYVRVQVVYDELAPLDDYEGVDITRLTRELKPKNPFELNLMRITVDGEPIDDPARSSSDIQRCTDVALDKANIEFRFDNLESRRRLAVAATPASVEFVDAGEEGMTASPVRFRMYANYGHFIERAEVRIFGHGQSVQSSPLQVLEIDRAGLAEWQPSVERFPGPVRELQYVLRAYDAKGNFDETSPKPLWMVYRTATAPEAEAEASAMSTADHRAARAAGSAAGAARRIRSGGCAGAGRDQSVGRAWFARSVRLRRSGRASCRPLRPSRIASCWPPMARTASRSATFSLAAARSRCGAAACRPGTAYGWRDGRCRSTRRATSSPRKSCRRAHRRSKSPCWTRPATGRSSSATSS